MKLERIRGMLERDPVSVAVVRQPAREGGVPEVAGIYAWWIVPGSLPGIDGPQHPSSDFELLYLGISPSRATSSATIGSRVRGQHLGGNIGSSTFRLTLAALLAKTEGWEPTRVATRATLRPEDNRALTAWQERYLRLTWVEVSEPWTIEAELIQLMSPPLNLAGNSGHPLHKYISDARRTLRNVVPDSERSVEVNAHGQDEVPNSPFLEVPESEWIASSPLAFAIRDRYPVTDGHSLVIARRSVRDWEGASDEEKADMFALVDRVIAALQDEFAPQGFNVGFNLGEAAGQTVPHLHVHVIPRYDGDVPDRRGGIRHVIPDKANYLRP